MSTEEIWNQFSPELKGFINKRVGNSAIAEDILQEVFVKIHLNSQSIKDDDKLLNWVYQITRNTIIDHYRKIKKEGKADTRIEDDVKNIDPLEFINCFTSFLRDLPAEQREALEETTLAEASIKSYADANGINYATAKSRIQRARQTLKSKILDCCAVEADIYGNILDHHCKKGKC